MSKKMLLIPHLKELSAKIARTVLTCGKKLGRTGTLILLFILGGNLLLWAGLNRPVQDEPWNGIVAGVSYSPYQKWEDPFKDKFPTVVKEMDRDLALLKGKVSSIRTYSSINGMEEVPRLAKKYGLTVTAGAWLDKRPANNEREIANLIRSAKKYDNIERVIVGNESVLRGDLTVPELIRYIERVRKEVKVPVSTAEPWHVWLAHKELAQHVDYIAIHVLPYWERVPAERAVDWVMSRYEQVKNAFPGKHILLAEVGWPSAGSRRGPAKPSVINEAKFVREFLNVASRQQLDYFIMEAFDQPWKLPLEGSVGAHWGIFNVERQAKFPMQGDILENPLWPMEAGLAFALAIFPILWFFIHFKEIRPLGQAVFAFLIQAAASLMAWTAFVPIVDDLPLFSEIMWGVLLPAQFGLLMVVLINGFEMTEMIWKPNLRRRFLSYNGSNDRYWPMVSLHVAVCNEPPDMVIQMLNSLARLDYPIYEVLVIDNNTYDARLWEPVKKHCKHLGRRFKFFHLGRWPGYKAGALNFALTRTDPKAEIIGVVDSDYIVQPNWLRSLVPHFDRPSVGFVQAPQDQRGWEGNLFKEMCNWEYNGFFHIGMVHRNERNAIIQHGTMTLIRKKVIDKIGKWSEWCICEDAEFGMRLLHAGYESVYVNECFGRGLTPDTFAGYKGQRFRWVYGAMQIIKHHWRWLVPDLKKGRGLTMAQKYHFAMGWLPWFADALHMIFTFAGLCWTAGLVVWPQYFEFPLAAFIVPTLGIFAFKITHSLALYKTRVPCTLPQRIGAAIAGMSLTHTIAKAVFRGLITSKQPFLRTPKDESRPPLIQGILMAREEGLMFLLLMLAACNIFVFYGGSDLEVLTWIAVLLIQSIPYLAAIIVSVASTVPTLADFKTWLNVKRPQMQRI
ncbi:glycosyltransferase [Dissulfurimicrobium hydrothermale]|uniref:glycosyltransferase n=1 Tax=Dissulfurimicrobium hydrothermale TaxID=1750598 RepID=UPI001EDBC275|nr:glycosyltransferase [Dissulfurimicrobium hydrothermale]UKL13078.1 glycosyltransferase [Dissulfurimicrobium hydrothermale]